MARPEVQEGDTRGGEVRRTRQHNEGCIAPFVGKECDCPPETVWVPLSVAENLAAALEEIARWHPRTLHVQTAQAALEVYRAAYPAKETPAAVFERENAEWDRRVGRELDGLDEAIEAVDGQETTG